eukprot:TRINITY_DN2744_c1_g1_i1.p1 TRINITY_DN2744_c1_g1~~TRINITY_DN2744_c1_g1_i1.p1  ORF type:complete len:217 (-),score=-25.06 TRINITY_DN2744_c1_g1_i1:30-680(-)
MKPSYSELSNDGKTQLIQFPSHLFLPKFLLITNVLFANRSQTIFTQYLASLQIFTIITTIKCYSLSVNLHCQKFVNRLLIYNQLVRQNQIIRYFEYVLQQRLKRSLIFCCPRKKPHRNINIVRKYSTNTLINKDQTKNEINVANMHHHNQNCDRTRSTQVSATYIDIYAAYYCKTLQFGCLLIRTKPKSLNQMVQIKLQTYCKNKLKTFKSWRPFQ